MILTYTFSFIKLYCAVSYEEDRLKFVWHNQKGYLRKSESLKELNAYLQSNITENCTSAHERGKFRRSRTRTKS